ncbi:hypothetical protein Trydic_g18955 [Trypoxylus dichotomus]
MRRDLWREDESGKLGNTRLNFTRYQHWSIQGWACHNINRASCENKFGFYVCVRSIFSFTLHAVGIHTYPPRLRHATLYRKNDRDSWVCVGVGAIRRYDKGDGTNRHRPIDSKFPIYNCIKSSY